MTYAEPEPKPLRRERETMSNDGATPLARLRVDQVGSLLRPAWLKDAYARHGRAELSDAELRETQDRAVREAIQRQEAIGLPIVTDGELRRLNFQDSFSGSASGFAATAGTLQFHEERVEGGAPGQKWDPGYGGAGPAVVHRRPALDKIRLSRNVPLAEYQSASALTQTPVKVAIIGPDRITQRFDYAGSRDIYPDVQGFVDDVVSVEQEMIRELSG